MQITALAYSPGDTPVSAMVLLRSKIAVLLTLVMLLPAMPVFCAAGPAHVTACHSAKDTTGLRVRRGCCPKGDMPCCADSAPSPAPFTAFVITPQAFSASITLAQSFDMVLAYATRISAPPAETAPPPVLSRKEDFRT